MTPFVTVVDGAQVEILFSFDGVNIENRLWFQDRNPPVTSTHLQALADGVAAWHTAQVMPHLSSALTRADVIATDWSGTSPGSLATHPAAVSGGGSSDVHSANVALRIWFIPTNDLRSLRNSNFVPGIPKSEVDLNLVSTTFRHDIQEAYINVIDLAPTWGGFPGWRWVCASAIEGGSLRTEQLLGRVDFIRYKRPWVAQRRRRLP